MPELIIILAQMEQGRLVQYIVAPFMETPWNAAWMIAFCSA
jgi:hypothetical protein